MQALNTNSSPSDIGSAINIAKEMGPFILPKAIKVIILREKGSLIKRPIPFKIRVSVNQRSRNIIKNMAMEAISQCRYSDNPWVSWMIIPIKRYNIVVKRKVTIFQKSKWSRSMTFLNLVMLLMLPNSNPAKTKIRIRSKRSYLKQNSKPQNLEH